MQRKDCDICQRKNLSWDTFLFENKEWMIVKNSHDHIRIDKKLYKVKKRFSLIPHEHSKSVSAYRFRKYKHGVEKYLYKKYSLKRKVDYDFFVSMGTYKNHWHMHICLYPFKLWKIHRKGEWLIL